MQLCLADLSRNANKLAAGLKAVVAKAIADAEWHRTNPGQEEDEGEQPSSAAAAEDEDSDLLPHSNDASNRSSVAGDEEGDQSGGAAASGEDMEEDDAGMAGDGDDDNNEDDNNNDDDHNSAGSGPEDGDQGDDDDVVDFDDWDGQPPKRSSSSTSHGRAASQSPAVPNPAQRIKRKRSLTPQLNASQWASEVAVHLSSVKQHKAELLATQLVQCAQQLLAMHYDEAHIEKLIQYAKRESD